MPDPHPAPSAGHMTLDELADLSVDELAGDDRDAATAHLAGCVGCREELDRLGGEVELVRAGLSAGLSDPMPGPLDPLPGSPPPTMPVTVAARLDRALAAEAASRALGPEVPAAGEPAPEGRGVAATVTPLRPRAPLKAPATASYVKQTGVVRIMLAAAVAATVVGFGGYVISATAGLNEPSAMSPAQVRPEALASEAAELDRQRDLDPHLFSQAWRCARKVTVGRVTGITPVYVAGEQNYLVYTRADGVRYATLVSGCDQTRPTVGDRVRLGE